jgi:hypothetical protein
MGYLSPKTRHTLYFTQEFKVSIYFSKSILFCLATNSTSPLSFFIFHFPLLNLLSQVIIKIGHKLHSTSIQFVSFTTRDSSFSTVGSSKQHLYIVMGNMVAMQAANLEFKIMLQKESTWGKGNFRHTIRY